MAVISTFNCKENVMNQSNRLIDLGDARVETRQLAPGSFADSETAPEGGRKPTP